jgi:hypothetical protein
MTIEVTEKPSLKTSSVLVFRFVLIFNLSFGNLLIHADPPEDLHPALLQ